MGEHEVTKLEGSLSHPSINLRSCQIGKQPKNQELNNRWKSPWKGEFVWVPWIPWWPVSLVVVGPQNGRSTYKWGFMAGIRWDVKSANPGSWQRPAIFEQEKKHISSCWWNCLHVPWNFPRMTWAIGLKQIEKHQNDDHVDGCCHFSQTLRSQKSSQRIKENHLLGWHNGATVR